MTDAAVAEPLVLTEDIGPVRRLTMNRPKALNALSHGLIEALSEAFRAAGADPDVSVIVLRGAGRAFCAGYDLTEDAAGGVLDARRWHEDLAHSTHGMLEILDNPKPVIAQVQSYCLAGGTDLMLACDLAVAADDAYFGYVDADEIAKNEPFVVQTTKRAVNRAWDVAGFRAAMAANTELDVMIETANLPARDEFRRITEAEGLKAAIAWRDARYRGES
jgi:hypothetical protein